MSKLVVEPLGSGPQDLKGLLAEIEPLAVSRFGIQGAKRILAKWLSLVSEEAGFVLCSGGECVGLLLYSAEYELGFSSFLSDSSAQRLPQNATIVVCHVLKRFRSANATNERLLLKSAVSFLRSTKSIETIAVQLSPTYELDLEEPLARMGFMNCRRVRMERRLTGRIPGTNPPPGFRIEPIAFEDADDLRSVINSGYFSEIDGYLFPDIATVCSDSGLFKEFLNCASIDLTASVLARMEGYPCGCVIALSGDNRQRGLVGVVAVAPGMRRRGIGRAMLLRSMHQMKRNHCTHAALAVTVENEPARSLYSSLGFEDAGRSSAISVWRRSVSRPLMIFRRRER